jgi:hypothetical protein
MLVYVRSVTVINLVPKIAGRNVEHIVRNCKANLMFTGN